MKMFASKLGVPLLFVLGSALYFGLAAFNFAFNPVPAEANTAPSSSYERTDLTGNDWAWNWDYRTKSASRTNVDWGMRYLFKDNASVNHVKQRLNGDHNNPNIVPRLSNFWGDGSTKHAHMKDGSRAGWASDGGIKDFPHCRWNSLHLRVYANGSGGRQYNQEYGYYVIASSHKDHESFWNRFRSCNNKYSSLEYHEDWLIDRVEDHLGSGTRYKWVVDDNALTWGNDVNWVIDIGGGIHKYQSDGRGPVIKVTGR